MASDGGLTKVRAVERAMALLQAFDPAALRLPLSDLSRRTGLDKGTTRRLLQTLVAGEFVEFDDRTKTYALGPGILLLVPSVRYGRDLRDVAAPILARLAERTGATSFIWTHFRGAALCLDRVKGPEITIEAVWSSIGDRVELNAAGGPRTLLAFLPPDDRARILAAPLPQYTARTQTDPAGLETAATRIRQRGWEFAVDDYVVGLSGLGAPILDRTGRLAASVSISTLTPKFAVTDGVPLLLPFVLEAAAEISVRLGQ
ncbi:IclR family transcriptional regulator [Enterovirga rhinocerotis]|uniref:IclR family transcriptional regulator n=1 Tax=Enterovirga rhinocerotis TaxID=1339210 RepID=A0A4R7BWH6_9HYPH|nr:IclR family transcriptional regulator [Enterovirga rhinocerotis]TDR89843.1 IclR family transcriptional regulator [Enterovirga rhinocerotis]